MFYSRESCSVQNSLFRLTVSGRCCLDGSFIYISIILIFCIDPSTSAFMEIKMSLFAVSRQVMIVATKNRDYNIFCRSSHSPTLARNQSSTAYSQYLFGLPLLLLPFTFPSSINLSSVFSDVRNNLRVAFQ